MFGSLFIVIKLCDFKEIFKIGSITAFYIFITMLFFGKFYNSYKYFDFRKGYIGEIKQIEKYLPDNSKIYQYDLAGHLGYYSNIRVINGDGRVNSFEYANNLLNQNLSNYLVINNICYLTDIFTQNLDSEKVLLNQSGLIVKYSDVDLINKFVNFNLYKLKNCSDN